MNLKRQVVFAVAFLMVVTGTLFAQTTGSLIGNVTTDGVPLPGVTVTATSPALQGTRTQVTDGNGSYQFAALPPGSYTVVFELEGMRTVTRNVNVPVAGTGRADAAMQLTSVAEAITVTASAPAVLETTEIQTNYEEELVEELPMGRTVTATALLAPGVTNNGPRNAMQISGSFASDNLVMVNGVVIQENLRGQPHSLFIEDAIQETTVMTAGVSAEYGRFTGGVISSITKSGGNEFSGSFRDSFTDPDWQEATDWPGDVDPTGELNEVYEGTLGGYIVRDRLWFFGAGRYYETQAFAGTFALGNTRQIYIDQEQLRWEGKLTAQITPNHSIVASYLDSPLESGPNLQIGTVYGEDAWDPSIEQGNDFLTARYTGILSSNFLIEAGYAEKTFEFIGFGGENEDLYAGTPGVVYIGGAIGQFNAPYFCGSEACGNESRDNEEFALKGTYYLSTSNLGTHNLTFGGTRWDETRVANNYQSPTNLTVWLYTQVPEYDPATDEYTFFVTNSDTIEYFPIEFPSQGSSLATDSLFINDKWDLNNHWTFNLGVRYDKNDAVDSFGTKTSDDEAVSPRLSAMYDVRGDGRIRVQASYGQYVGRLAETVAGASSPAGSPHFFMYYYGGEPFSGNAREVVTGMLDWLMANGGTDRLPDYASIGGVNTVIGDTLQSPDMSEWTIGAGFQVGTRGYVRADYISRDWDNYYVEITNQETGSVIEPRTGVEFDLTVVDNTNQIERTYDAIQLSGSYRLLDRLNIGGNYTWSELKGNAEGEGTAGGPAATGGWIFEYPEYQGFDRNAPVGFLSGDQTHKLRAWISYDQPTPIGNFNFSLLQRFDTGTPYSAVTGNARVQDVRSIDANYQTPPTYQTYYFSDRGEFRWDDVTATDLAVNYALPLGPTEVFVQAEMFNVFNEQAVVGGNTFVNVYRTSLSGCGAGGAERCAPFDPFNDTPVEGVNYSLGDNFGQPTGPASYQAPRAYQFSVGLRF